MVLKIKGYGEDDWWVYGEVRRSHHEIVQMCESMKEDHDLLLFAEDAKGLPKCLRIVLRFVNGNEFSILTDSIAYLCNDCGETIEKIVS